MNEISVSHKIKRLIEAIIISREGEIKKNLSFCKAFQTCRVTDLLKCL